MILRNVAIRHGRSALAAPLRRSFLRSMTTDTLTHETDALSHSPASTNSTSLKTFVPPSDAGESLDSIKTDYASQQRLNKRTGKLGSAVEKGYVPDALVRNPPKPADVTLELLMASQSHLGHSTSLWNPANQRYIFGIRQGIHIISLEETAAHLRRAAKVVEGVAYHGGLILFVGTRAGQGPAIVKAARLSKGCHLFEKWIPGSITNGDQILSRCDIKVVDKDDVDITSGFEDKIGDWKALKPDLVVCMNPLENYIMLHECGLNNIPTIGVIDTDADPTWVTYPIPANDDSLRCIQVIAGVLGRAGQEGQRRRLEAAKTGHITWLPPFGLGSPETAEDKKAAANKVRRGPPTADEIAAEQSRGKSSKQEMADIDEEL
ncbi:37S ribosomal protein MRP4, mitochondrial [Lachnellula subtilissima]|uniref:37S ribosomal protein MRP4, mitochondrial n=1 Tax=Lachnellula subtilissima TaxID=602034 RepID=A0A8H8S2L9_9HELO|nr:37S ribosomal protein MRP4, mitochondrial [Lachnellula subtilissima]